MEDEYYMESSDLYDREFYDESGDEIPPQPPVSRQPVVEGGAIICGTPATVKREFPVTPQKDDEENPKRLV